MSKGGQVNRNLGGGVTFEATVGGGGGQRREAESRERGDPPRLPSSSRKSSWGESLLFSSRSLAPSAALSQRGGQTPAAPGEALAVGRGLGFK